MRNNEKAIHAACTEASSMLQTDYLTLIWRQGGSYKQPSKVVALCTKTLTSAISLLMLSVATPVHADFISVTWTEQASFFRQPYSRHSKKQSRHVAIANGNMPKGSVLINEQWNE